VDVILNGQFACCVWIRHFSS